MICLFDNGHSPSGYYLLSQWSIQEDKKIIRKIRMFLMFTLDSPYRILLVILKLSEMVKQVKRVRDFFKDSFPMGSPLRSSSKPSGRNLILPSLFL